MESLHDNDCIVLEQDIETITVIDSEDEQNMKNEGKIYTLRSKSDDFTITFQNEKAAKKLSEPMKKALKEIDGDLVFTISSLNGRILYKNVYASSQDKKESKKNNFEKFLNNIQSYLAETGKSYNQPENLGTIQQPHSSNSCDTIDISNKSPLNANADRDFWTAFVDSSDETTDRNIRTNNVFNEAAVADYSNDSYDIFLDEDEDLPSASSTNHTTTGFKIISSSPKSAAKTITSSALQQQRQRKRRGRPRREHIADHSNESYVIFLDEEEDPPSASSPSINHTITSGFPIISSSSKSAATTLTSSVLQKQRQRRRRSRSALFINAMVDSSGDTTNPNININGVTTEEAVADHSNDSYVVSFDEEDNPSYTISSSPNSPAMSTNSAATTTSSALQQQCQKERRGRPRKEHSDKPDPAQLVKLSKAERKFVEGRAKNNEASRKSRLKSKHREEVEIEEQDQLMAQNIALKAELEQLEHLTKKLKSALDERRLRIN